ncbi:hypothetical protein DMENIID0001_061550 [Sergentomyia squamirostris]
MNSILGCEYNSEVTADHGFEYQEELLLHFCLRLMELDAGSFFVGFEVKKFPKLDDIVVEFDICERKYLLLIQAKHVLSQKRQILPDHLYGITMVPPKDIWNNFNLRQYIHSAMTEEVQEKLDGIENYCLRYIIMTNLVYVHEDEVVDERNIDLQDLFESLTDRGADIHKFGPNCSDKIQAIIDDNLVESKIKVRNLGLDYFQDKLMIACRMPNLEKLCSINDKIMKKNYKVFNHDSFQKIFRKNVIKFTAIDLTTRNRKTLHKADILSIISETILEHIFMTRISEVDVVTKFIERVFTFEEIGEFDFDSYHSDLTNKHIFSVPEQAVFLVEYPLKIYGWVVLIQDTYLGSVPTPHAGFNPPRNPSLVQRFSYDLPCGSNRTENFSLIHKMNSILGCEYNSEVTADHGFVYQEELLLHFCLRLMELDAGSFFVGFEVKKFPKLDDIVVQFDICERKYLLLIQAKHVLSQKRQILPDHLYGITMVPPKDIWNNFNLRQYIHSAMTEEVQEKLDGIENYCLRYIIMTNLVYVHEDEVVDERNIDLQDLFESLTDRGAEIHKFGPNCSDKIQAIIDDNLVESKIKVRNLGLDYFQDKLMIACRMPNLEKLCSINDKIMKKNYKVFNHDSFQKIFRKNVIKFTAIDLTTRNRKTLHKSDILSIISETILESAFSPKLRSTTKK